jgi:hypothetical protein
LLGLYNPYELKIINDNLSPGKLKYIRSCDSAAPWQAAQCNITFNKDYGVVTKPKAFLDFDKKSINNEVEVLEKNLILIKKWSKHK